MPKPSFAGVSGIPLPRRAIKVLRERGIYAHSLLSIEHQELARAYVLRGLESGGSIADVGRYVTFATEDGQKLQCLHPVDAIAVNGLHAVVIASALVRVDMLRKDRTYELLITAHRLSPTENGSRPQLESQILFRGVHGRLELDLSRRDRTQAGHVVPLFYSLAGEQVAIPGKFLRVVSAVTHGVNCIGCSHSHYLRRPNLLAMPASKAESESAIEVQSAQNS
jgi:hypothetical protein